MMNFSGSREKEAVMVIELNDVNQTPARNPKWIVVRCPGAVTLDYERELVDQDVGVWTPAFWVRKRLPRRRLKVWAQVPILPGYLFMWIPDLPKFGGLPWSYKADLRPMSISGRYVVLDEEDLSGLRELDQREKPEGRRATPQNNQLPDPQLPESPKWKVGDKVRVKGVLAGAEGVVASVPPGEDVVVALKNSPAKVKVSGFLLEQIALYGGEQGPS